MHVKALVLDASAVVELLLGTATGRRVAARLADDRLQLHAPELLDLQVAQVLRRFERSRQIAADEAATALERLQLLDIERHAHGMMLPRVWALRANLTAYDAVYVALAELLDAPLLTADARLQRAIAKRGGVGGRAVAQTLRV